MIFEFESTGRHLVWRDSENLREIAIVGTGMGGDVDGGGGRGREEEIHTLQPNVMLLKSFLPREIKIATS